MKIEKSMFGNNLFTIGSLMLIVGIILILTSSFFSYSKYSDAESKLKSLLIDPDSLAVDDAWMDEDKESISMLFNSKNGFGGYGQTALFVYYINGSNEGTYLYIEQDDVYNGEYLYDLGSQKYSFDIDIPQWKINGNLNPLLLLGLIISSIGVLIGIKGYSQNKNKIVDDTVLNTNSIEVNDKTFDNTGTEKYARLKNMLEQNLITQVEFNKLIEDDN